MKDIIDFSCDQFDKVISSAGRAGHTAERVSLLLENNVDKDVIALQLTKNSKRGKEYTSKCVDVINELFLDSKSKVGITQKQTTALIKVQRMNDAAEREDKESNQVLIL